MPGDRRRRNGDSAVSLSPVGTSSYNGVTFGSSAETLAFTVTPVYDASGRTVVDATHAMTLRFVVHLTSGDSGNTDSQADALRDALTKPAGQLIYQSKGLGNITVNGGSGPKDVRWGPL